MKEQLINLDQFKNLKIAPTRAKNIEELYDEVQNELLNNLYFKMEALKYCINNNDIQKAQEWVNDVDQTFRAITHKYCEYEESQFEKELNYIVLNFKNNEVNIESHYFNDWNEFNKVYESSSKLHDYYWSILDDNYNTLENAIFVNLFNEIDSHNKISNSNLLDDEIQTYEIINSSKKDGFIKLNEKSILLLNPFNNDSTSLDSISFTNSEIKELEKNKEYLNDIKTKFFNISKEREM